MRSNSVGAHIAKPFQLARVTGIQIGARESLTFRKEIVSWRIWITRKFHQRTWSWKLSLACKCSRTGFTRIQLTSTSRPYNINLSAVDVELRTVEDRPRPGLLHPKQIFPRRRLFWNFESILLSI